MLAYSIERIERQFAQIMKAIGEDQDALAAFALMVHGLYAKFLQKTKRIRAATSRLRITVAFSIESIDREFEQIMIAIKSDKVALSAFGQILNGLYGRYLPKSNQSYAEIIDAVLLKKKRPMTSGEIARQAFYVLKFRTDREFNPFRSSIHVAILRGVRAGRLERFERGDDPQYYLVQK